MPLIRTNRKYSRQSDLEVSKLAGRTINGFSGNLVFVSPPVPPVALTELKNTFDAAIIVADKGGPLATAQKDVARAALIDALNKNASYVDINSNDDTATLLSSGYEPVNTNRAQTVLAAPMVVASEHGQAGELRLRVRGDANRRALLGRIKAKGGEFGPVVTFRGPREILFRQLTAGTTYVMQLCGLGGSTGQSDWSEAVEKMAL
jgi:hypothetical protein